MEKNFRIELTEREMQLVLASVVWMQKESSDENYVALNNIINRLEHKIEKAVK